MIISDWITAFCWGGNQQRWIYMGGGGVGWFWMVNSALIWVDYIFRFLWITVNCDKFREQYIYSYLPASCGVVGCKVTFKRKGSWVRFKRYWPRAISLKFGYAHSIRISYMDGFYCRRKKYLQRHSLFMGGGQWDQILRFSKEIRMYRFFGRYTKRGVRLAREFFYRQQGKESQYTHLKSKIY